MQNYIEQGLVLAIKSARDMAAAYVTQVHSCFLSS